MPNRTLTRWSGKFPASARGSNGSLRRASHVLADRIADGCSVRYQVPDAVLAYIRQLGLYRK
jgi:nicotinic acid mononucleotide adenylyltransferase